MRQATVWSTKRWWSYSRAESKQLAQSHSWEVAEPGFQQKYDDRSPHLIYHAVHNEETHPLLIHTSPCVLMSSFWKDDWLFTLCQAVGEVLGIEWYTKTGSKETDTLIHMQCMTMRKRNAKRGAYIIKGSWPNGGDQRGPPRRRDLYAGQWRVDRCYLGEEEQQKSLQRKRDVKDETTSSWLAHLKASLLLFLDEERISNFLMYSFDWKSFCYTVLYIFWRFQYFNEYIKMHTINICIYIYACVCVCVCVYLHPKVGNQKANPEILRNVMVESYELGARRSWFSTGLSH